MYSGKYNICSAIKYHYYVSPKNESNNIIVSLQTIISGNFNVICYYSEDVVPSYLGSISHKYFNTI